MRIFRAECNVGCKIDEYELMSETDLFVTVKGASAVEFKNRKESTTHKYFWNYSEAKEWLMDRIDLKIRAYQIDIDRLKSQKQKVNNL